MRFSNRRPRRSRALIAVTATALATASAAIAGYGPEAPPGPAVPGGFSSVIASRTIGRSGGTLNVKTGHTGLRLNIPKRALTRRVQFTFTRPRLSGVRTAVPKGKRLVVGFALLANEGSGGPIRGLFSRRAVSIAISDRGVTQNTQVLAWNQARHRFVRFAAVAQKGRVVLVTRHFGEFLVISPR
jgi:hypothetical protein